MNLTRGAAAVLTVGMLLIPTGCGKDTIEDAKKTVSENIPRASTDEVADALRTTGQKAFGKAKNYTKAQAACIADLVEQSDLSNKAIKDFITDPGSFNPSAADAAVLEKMTTPIKACLKK